MELSRFSRVTVTLLFALAATSSHSFAAEAGRLYGTVADPLGALITNAKVELLRDQQQAGVTTTDREGKYQLTAPIPGRYRVRATAAGFAIQESAPVYVGNSGATEINLVLNIGTVAQQVVISSTGTEVPESQIGASVTVITRQQFDDALDVFEPLRQVAGAQVVQIGQHGAAASLFLRGSNSNANKVLIDGIPANDIGGVVNFGILSATGVEQAEVLRGPNSVLYGSDALAGAVSLTTRRGSTPLPEISYLFDAGNFNNLRHDASLGGAFRRLDYFSEYSRFDAGNSVPNSRFHNGAYAGNFGIALNATTEVRLTARHTDTALGSPNAVLLFGIADDSQQRDQDSYLGVTLQNQTTSRWHNLLRYGASRLRTQFVNPSPTGMPFDPFGFGSNFLGNLVTIHGANGFSETGQAILDFGGTYPIESSSSSKRDFVQLQSDYSFGPKLLALFGFKYENERGFTLAGGTKSSTRRGNFSYTGELQSSLGGRLYAALGAGVENNDIFGVAVTPRVSLAYYLLRPRPEGPLSGAKLKFNYGQGIKEPSIFEETSSLFGLLSQLPNGPQLISQFRLAPISAERSRSFDAGIEQSAWNGRAKLSATFFHNQFTNQVEFVSNTALPQLGVPAAVAAQTAFGATVNSADTRALGAETALDLKLGNGFSARGTYTYLDAVVQRSFSGDALSPAINPDFPNIPIGAFSPLVGNRPFRRAPHTGSFLIGYARSKYTVNLGGYLVSRRDDSTFLSDGFFGNSMLLPNRNLTAGYQKIDLAARYRLNSHLSLHGSVENLANQRYADAFGFPALPLTFRTGLKITLGGESWRSH